MTTIFGTSNNDTLTGSSGSDIIYGQGGEDTLVGGTGNDTLSGGSGNDTYLFNLGDGQDSILDSGASTGETNRLQFGAGIASTGVTVVESNGGDLVITINGTTDKITLRNQLLAATGGVDQVVFADGTVWTRAALLALATASTAGNDTFYGDYAANTLDGGTGNDTLSGGTGNDLYQFNLGDGQDTIFDNGSSSSTEVNALRLGPGISADHVTVTEVNGGSDLLISIAGTSDTILLRNQLAA